MDQLINLLRNIKSTQNGQLIIITEVKTNKKHRITKQPFPFKLPIKKLSYLNIEVNTSYKDKVNDGRLIENKETNFVPTDNWGEHDGCETLIRCNDKLYVQFILKEKYRTSTYVDSNGRYLMIEELLPYLPPISPNKSQGLDQPIVIRRVMVENVIELYLEGRKVYNKISG